MRKSPFDINFITNMLEGTLNLDNFHSTYMQHVIKLETPKKAGKDVEFMGPDEEGVIVGMGMRSSTGKVEPYYISNEDITVWGKKPTGYKYSQEITPESLGLNTDQKDDEESSQNHDSDLEEFNHEWVGICSLNLFWLN